MLQQQDRELDVGRALRRGIAANEIVPYYQPKASLVQSGWVIDGVEALARWQHPRLGIVMPRRVHAARRATGLIGDLTNSDAERGAAAGARVATSRACASRAP